MTPIECTIIIGYLCKCISDYMITTIYSFGKKAIELLMVFANNHGNGLSDVLTRYRPRFFDQVGHQTTNASMGNKHFFTK